MSEHINSISATNHKEEDRKRILEYIKGKAEVYVSDISENSGAERLRAYPILFEEIQAGYFIPIKSDALGAPVIVALSQQ